MPGPDCSFLHEYRLNSKPRDRRILQRQQSEAKAQQLQPLQAAVEPSWASLPQQQAQAARAEPSTLYTSESELAPSWRLAGPRQQADRPGEHAQFIGEPPQASGLRDAPAGSWRTVTASQMLRVTAPSQQQQQQQQRVSDATSDMAGNEAPLLHVLTEQQQQPQQHKQLKRQQKKQQTLGAEGFMGPD